MTFDGEVEMHETRKVREGDSVTVTIPPEAVEQSGIEPGENCMVGSLEDGPVVLVPWSDEDIRDLIGDE